MMKKAFAIYKMALKDNMSDPGKTYIWMIVGATYNLVFMYTWMVAAAGKETIGSMQTDQVISYYIYLFIIWYVIGGTFKQMIEETIRTGKLSTQLIKPAFPFLKDIFYEQAWKTFGLFTSIPIVIGFVMIFSGHVRFDFEISNILLTIPSILFGTLIFMEMELILGCMTFWSHRIDGIQRIYFSLSDIFGGKIAPLALMPTFVQTMAFYLPFRYIFSFPIEIINGQLTSSAISSGYVFQISWLIMLFIVSSSIYKLGLKKYESFGN